MPIRLDGISICPDGMSIRPDGMSIHPDGMPICLDGMSIRPDGMSIHPDGELGENANRLIIRKPSLGISTSTRLDQIQVPNLGLNI